MAFAANIFLSLIISIVGHSEGAQHSEQRYRIDSHALPIDIPLGMLDIHCLSLLGLSFAKLLLELLQFYAIAFLFLALLLCQLLLLCGRRLGTFHATLCIAIQGSLSCTMLVAGDLQLNPLAYAKDAHFLAAQLWTGTLPGVTDGQAAMTTGEL